VRAERSRKKKLIVAFHFLRLDTPGAGQAGWKCEQCRRQGLEIRRRCGFLPEAQRGASRAVWVRGRAIAEECPKSLVTAASVEFLEKFFAWKFSGRYGEELTAREADAFLILEKEWRAEQINGQ
jgi:hypothetical protein